MPVIRNPFRKTASTVHHHHSAASSVEKLSDPLSASDTPTTDATPVSAVAIKNDDDKNSYKMSGA